MSEISTASREQSTAVEQVSRAVVDRTRAPRSTASWSADSAQAAHSLQQQAQALAAAMAAFRLDNQGGAAQRQTPAANRSARAVREPSPAF